MTEGTWRKSSYSGSTAGSDCVAVRGTLDAVQDTKNTGVVQSQPGLPALIKLVQAGRFDLSAS